MSDEEFAQKLALLMEVQDWLFDEGVFSGRFSKNHSAA